MGLWCDWEKEFNDDILAQLRKVKASYNIWGASIFFLFLLGMAMVLLQMSTRCSQMGMLTVIAAIGGMVVIELYTHIKISMFRIMWDNKKRMEKEINKMQAEDL